MYSAAPVKATSGYAVTALIMGILSVIPYLNLITFILAIIFGSLGIKAVNREPHRLQGKGMAIAGLVLGIVFGLLWVIVIMAATVFVLVQDLGASPSPSPSPN
jgi:hypothetical protein